MVRVGLSGNWNISKGQLVPKIIFQKYSFPLFSMVRVWGWVSYDLYLNMMFNEGVMIGRKCSSVSH